MSADRFKQAAKANDSGSWNKYLYTRGDPVNRIDPHGKEDCFDEEGCEDECDLDPALCGDPGGGGPPPPPPPTPLQCNFTGATNNGIVSQVTRTSGGHAGSVVNGAFVSMNFDFSASGGDGNYSWSDKQTVNTSGSIALSNGKIISLNSTSTESIVDLLPPNSPNATFNDKPGLAFATSNGATIVAATAVWNLSLTVSVSSAGQTVQCATVNWQVSEIWQFLNGTYCIFGSGEVTGVTH